MARYTANEDIEDGRVQFAKGQEVDVSEIPSGYFGKFSLVVGKNNDPILAAGEDAPTGIINPDREGLKALADELGLAYPANISTTKLQAMIDKHYADQDQE